MTADPRPEPARTYRAGSGPVSLIVSALLALFLLGDAVIRAGWVSMLLLAPWVLLGLWVVYEVAVASFVRTAADGATVQNLLRRTTFGWRRVRDVDLRWQLVFSLDDGADVTCFGGPARARPVRNRGAHEEAPKIPSGLRDLTEIRDRWETAPAAADAPIRRSWDMPALIALGVIVIWAIAAVLIANAG